MINKTIYLVRVDGMVCCSSPTKELAQKMMERFALYEEWNRQSKIMHKSSSCITLENYTRIDIDETTMYRSYKRFLQSMRLETPEV